MVELTGLPGAAMGLLPSTPGPPEPSILLLISPLERHIERTDIQRTSVFCHTTVYTDAFDSYEQSRGLLLQDYLQMSTFKRLCHRHAVVTAKGQDKESTSQDRNVTVKPIPYLFHQLGDLIDFNR